MRFILVLLCAVSAGVASADVCTSEVAVARQALRDGLWLVARNHAAKVPGDTGRLIVLESYASENRWEEVKRELAKIPAPDQNPAFGYYLAVTSGKISQAIDLLRVGGSEAGLAEAKMLEADLRLRNAETNEARRLWTDVLSMTNAGERARALASVNLEDVEALRAAYGRLLSVPLKRTVGLRLGRALVAGPSTLDEGEKLIRALVSDSPDAEGACEAFVSMALAELKAGKWNDALKTTSDALEIWPAAAKRADVQECRGEAFRKLGRFEESLQAYVKAEASATEDAVKARTILRQGDMLAELGKETESMSRYRTVLDAYPATATAQELKRVLALRERETQGRTAYRDYRFEEAMKAFAEVAAADGARRDRMRYFQLLCLYGLGRDGEARRLAEGLATDCADAAVRADAALWLAKFTYNRGEWRDALARFESYAEENPTSPSAPDALLWASRAAFAANDFARAIKTATQLVERHPHSPAATAALLTQAEALIELARFDEAVLVLDRMASAEGTTRETRLRARLLKADALFAMGADNSARYQAALEAYRAVSEDPTLDPTARLVVAFKIGRTLEKLKKSEEATDLYYTEVVLAYRNGRLQGLDYTAEGQATFTRAAFRLADDFEARGRDYQAIGVLKLVVESDVPSAAEAEARIRRISKKGRFL